MLESEIFCRIFLCDRNRHCCLGGVPVTKDGNVYIPLWIWLKVDLQEEFILLPDSSTLPQLNYCHAYHSRAGRQVSHIVGILLHFLLIVHKGLGQAISGVIKFSPTS